MKNRALRPNATTILLYLLPALLLYSYIVTFPILGALRLSFFRWMGGARMEFDGLGNYATLLKDGIFWQSFLNNVTITLVCLVGQIGIAVVFALMLGSRLIRSKGFFRTTAFFPATLSAVVVGFVWTFIFDYRFGMMNTVLRLFGLDWLTKAWLDDPSTIVLFVSVPIVWQYIGFYMVIILSAVSSIDPGVLESAEIDGATSVQKAFRVTLPMIMDTLAVAVMLCISGNMKIFDSIYVMTNGGPGNSSMVVAMYVYKTSFIDSDYGYGGTVSIGILLLSLALILLSRRLIGGRRERGR